MSWILCCAYIVKTVGLFFSCPSFSLFLWLWLHPWKGPVCLKQSQLWNSDLATIWGWTGNHWRIRGFSWSFFPFVLQKKYPSIIPSYFLVLIYCAYFWHTPPQLVPCEELLWLLWLKRTREQNKGVILSRRNMHNTFNFYGLFSDGISCFFIRCKSIYLMPLVSRCDIIQELTLTHVTPKC